tara:strand:- start:170 stop:901 length:732 start_codon:yes stop_codon:yes gene_type:complete
MSVTIGGSGSITSSDGTVNFGDDNLSTTGTIPAAQLTGTVPAGSLSSATYPTNVPNVAPGSDGNVLTAASGAWTSAAAGGGAFTKISSGSLSNQLLTVTGITGDIKIIINLTGNFTGSAWIAQLSSDNGSSFAGSDGDYFFSRQQMILNSAVYNGDSITSGTPSSRIIQGHIGNYAEFDIMVPQLSTERTGCFFRSASLFNSTTLGRAVYCIGMRATAQVDNAIQISSAGAGMTGNFVVMKIT